MTAVGCRRLQRKSKAPQLRVPGGVMPLTQLGKWAVLYSIVGLEVAAGGVCYYYWRRMNTSQGAVIPTMANLAMAILCIYITAFVLRLIVCRITLIICSCFMHNFKSGSIGLYIRFMHQMVISICGQCAALILCMMQCMAVIYVHIAVCQPVWLATNKHAWERYL